MAPRIKVGLVVVGIVVPILILAGFGYSRVLDARAQKAKRDAFEARIAALKPKLTKDRVLQIAQECVVANKIDLSQYRPPELSLSQHQGQKLMWFVSFSQTGEIRAVGSDWGISVDDETGESRILLGM